MSAFISIVDDDEAVLLTDGAACRSGVLVDVTTKVFRSKSGAVAVTTRGHWEYGQSMSRSICDLADKIGPAALIYGLQDVASALKDEFGILDGWDAVQVVVVAYVPGVGGAHRTFDTCAVVPRAALGQHFGTSAYRVVTPPSLYVSGTSISLREMDEGDLHKRSHETTSQWIRRSGLGMLNVMRRRVDLTGNGLSAFAIGGKLDMTTVSETGSTFETLHTWHEDKIGKRIEVVDVFTKVQPAGINRAERRRLARAA